MNDTGFEVLKSDTFIRAIENSVGTKLFNSLFVQFKDTGKKIDILNNGELSCAFFVSSLLVLFQAIDKPHATVANLKKIITENKKWTEVNQADVIPGDVVFYEKTFFEDGTANEHVGFVLNLKEAVSTSYKQKQVVRHDLSTRPIASIYRYSFDQ